MKWLLNQFETGEPDLTRSEMQDLLLLGITSSSMVIITFILVG